MTEEELVQSVKSKEKEINELLLETHKMRLKVKITQGKQKTAKKLGQGFRSDVFGYEASALLISLSTKKKILKYEETALSQPQPDAEPKTDQAVLPGIMENGG